MTVLYFWAVGTWIIFRMFMYFAVCMVPTVYQIFFMEMVMTSF